MGPGPCATGSPNTAGLGPWRGGGGARGGQPDDRRNQRDGDAARRKPGSHARPWAGPNIRTQRSAESCSCHLPWRPKQEGHHPNKRIDRPTSATTPSLKQAQDNTKLLGGRCSLRVGSRPRPQPTKTRALPCVRERACVCVCVCSSPCMPARTQPDVSGRLCKPRADTSSQCSIRTPC